MAEEQKPMGDKSAEPEIRMAFDGHPEPDKRQATLTVICHGESASERVWNIRDAVMAALSTQEPDRG